MRSVLLVLLIAAFSLVVVGCGEPAEPKPGEGGKKIEKETGKEKESGDPAEQPEGEKPKEEAEKPKEPAKPKFVFRVNCGSLAEYKDPDGNVWHADKEYLKGGWGSEDGQMVTREEFDEIEGTKLHPVYLNELYGMTDYRIPVPKGTYTVVLHFAETYQEDPDMRVFDVAIEGKQVLKDFDPTKAAGKALKAVVKKFDDIEVTDGELTVTFTMNVENPMINGIEVIEK